jgi:Arm DNA-binding domain
MARITKRTIDALKPQGKPYIVYDGDVKGFGVRVAPGGMKSYILEYRPGAGGRGVAKKRLTLGRHGALTAEQAREAALDALARVRLGPGPTSREGAPAGGSNGWRACRGVSQGPRWLEAQGQDARSLRRADSESARRIRHPWTAKVKLLGGAPVLKME